MSWWLEHGVYKLLKPISSLCTVKCGIKLLINSQTSVATYKDCKWINNFIPHFRMDVITYPCCDESYSGTWILKWRPVSYFIPWSVLNIASDWLPTVQYRSVSHLPSSAWDVKKKEHHWWRHKGDSDRCPCPLPLRCDRVCLYNGLGQINGIAHMLKLQECFTMWQTSFEHGIKSLPFVCLHRHRNLSTLNITIACLAFRPRVVLRCSVWINSRIRVSKQGVTISICWGWHCDKITIFKPVS